MPSLFKPEEVSSVYAYGHESHLDIFSELTPLGKPRNLVVPQYEQL